MHDHAGYVHLVTDLSSHFSKVIGIFAPRGKTQYLGHLERFVVIQSKRYLCVSLKTSENPKSLLEVFARTLCGIGQVEEEMPCFARR